MGNGVKPVYINSINLKNLYCRDKGVKATIMKNTKKVRQENNFFICGFIQKNVLMNSLDSQSKSGSPSASTPVIVIS